MTISKAKELMPFRELKDHHLACSNEGLDNEFLLANVVHHDRIGPLLSLIDRSSINIMNFSVASIIFLVNLGFQKNLLISVRNWTALQMTILVVLFPDILFIYFILFNLCVSSQIKELTISTWEAMIFRKLDILVSSFSFIVIFTKEANCWTIFTESLCKHQILLCPLISCDIGYRLW